jgi:hypothetical protein
VVQADLVLLLPYVNLTKLVLNGHGFMQLTFDNLWTAGWSSESHSDEEESKDGFDEHHGVRSMSRGRDGCTEENEKTKLVREGRNVTLLYTLDSLAEFLLMIKKWSADHAADDVR